MSLFSFATICSSVLGQLYQKLERKHDAEKTFRTGMTVAAKAGDEHTRSELEAALESLLGE